MNKNLPACVFFYVLSMAMFLSSQNWFSAWVSMEMNTITFLCLMFLSTKKKMESVMLYFTMQSMTSMFLLYGVSSQEQWSWMMTCPSIIVMTSLLMKLGGAPFNNWFVSLCFFICHKIPFWLMMTLQKMIPLVLLMSNAWKTGMMFCLMLIASVSMGALMNLKQNTMKMILTLSSLSNLSWLMAASAWKSTLWELYFTIYSVILITAMPFLSENKQSVTNMMSSINLLLIMLTLGSLPPLMGFFPKMMISMAMLKHTMLTILVTMLMFSAMDIFIYSRISCTPLMKANSSMMWKNTLLVPKMNLFVMMSLMTIVLFTC